jgi:hypothetical protein
MLGWPLWQRAERPVGQTTPQPTTTPTEYTDAKRSDPNPDVNQGLRANDVQLLDKCIINNMRIVLFIDMEPDDMHFLLLFFAYLSKYDDAREIAVSVVVGGGNSEIRTKLYSYFYNRYIKNKFRGYFKHFTFQGEKIGQYTSPKKKFEEYVNEAFNGKPNFEVPSHDNYIDHVADLFKHPTLCIVLKQFHELEKICERRTPASGSIMALYAGTFNIGTDRGSDKPDAANISRFFEAVHFVSAAPFVGDNNKSENADMSKLTRYHSATNTFISNLPDLKEFIKEMTFNWNVAIARKWFNELFVELDAEEGNGKTHHDAFADKNKDMNDFKNYVRGRWNHGKHDMLVYLEHAKAAVDKLINESIDKYEAKYEKIERHFMIGKLKSMLNNLNGQGVIADPLVMYILTSNNCAMRITTDTNIMAFKPYWKVKTDTQYIEYVAIHGRDEEQRKLVEAHFVELVNMANGHKDETTTSLDKATTTPYS